MQYQVLLEQSKLEKENFLKTIQQLSKESNISATNSSDIIQKTVKYLNLFFESL